MDISDNEARRQPVITPVILAGLNDIQRSVALIIVWLSKHQAIIRWGQLRLGIYRGIRTETEF